MMIVAPTEPKKLRDIASNVSLYPETMGADILLISKGRKIGIQRKELNDLLASLPDGRLGQQFVQMAALDYAVLLIEGRPRFSMDGELMNASGFGRSINHAQFQGVLWSAMLRGIWVDYTDDLNGTVQWLQWFEKWLSKDQHDSLIKREPVYSPWGTPGNEDFQRHIIMGVPGIGVGLADAILKEIGMPFRLKVDREELEKVKGLGKKKIDGIMRAFGEE